MENLNILNTLFDMSLNDINNNNPTRYAAALRDLELSQQRHLFGNFLLNNQDNNDEKKTNHFPCHNFLLAVLNTCVNANMK